MVALRRILCNSDVGMFLCWKVVTFLQSMVKSRGQKIYKNKKRVQNVSKSQSTGKCSFGIVSKSLKPTDNIMPNKSSLLLSKLHAFLKIKLFLCSPFWFHFFTLGLRGTCQFLITTFALLRVWPPWVSASCQMTKLPLLTISLRGYICPLATLGSNF